MQPTIINKKLSAKERMFVEAYCGDTLEAMIVAGYSGEETNLRSRGNQLLVQPYIQNAIKERSKYTSKMSTVIANRDDRQAFWTSIMFNDDPNHKKDKDPLTGHELAQPNIPMNVRLKASELLGKAEGDFVERIDLNAKVSISDVIQGSYQLSNDEASIDDIEAAYLKARAAKKLSEDTVEVEEKDYSITDSLI